MRSRTKWTAGLVIVMSLLAFLCGWKASKAQNTTFSIQIAPGTTSANCVLAASQTTYCFTGGGVVYVSINGATFTPLVPPPVAAGVSSVTVCNVAGTSCGTAQTGAVTVNVPKTVTVTVGAATGTLQ